MIASAYTYVGLGISVWLYAVPPTLIIYDAAAARSSQAFLLVGAAVLIPVVLDYTGYL